MYSYIVVFLSHAVNTHFLMNSTIRGWPADRFKLTFLSMTMVVGVQKMMLQAKICAASFQFSLRTLYTCYQRIPLHIYDIAAFTTTKPIFNSQATIMLSLDWFKYSLCTDNSYIMQRGYLIIIGNRNKGWDLRYIGRSARDAPWKEPWPLFLITGKI